jgi:hypothetical protein
MTTNPRIKTKVPHKVILLTAEGVGKKNRRFFENWGFRNSPIIVPPDRLKGETGRRLIYYLSLDWPELYSVMGKVNRGIYPWGGVVA